MKKGKKQKVKQSKTKKGNFLLDLITRIEYNIKYVKRKGVEMAKSVNYTDEMVNTMTEQYAANPTRETVDALADQFGKTTRSIIAKLSREGVYVAQPRTTKSGEPVISKAELVATINEHFGIEMPTLVKAGKQDLQKLVDAISQ
tara:strand:+ start:814 stop:1245 length:432 start_codon:yes stop_codon:yes gene_type:complete